MFQIEVKVEDLIDELKKIIADQAVEIALIKSKMQVLTNALLRLEKGEKIVTGPAIGMDGKPLVNTEPASAQTSVDHVHEGDE